MFTRVEVRTLRVDLEREFAEVGKKLGVKLNFDRMSYGEEVRFKLNITKSNGQSEENPKPKDEVAFVKYATMFGLTPEDLHRKFVSNGSTFEIIGIQPNRRKYPIIGKGVRGGKYIFATDVVKNNMV